MKKKRKENKKNFTKAQVEAIWQRAGFRCEKCRRPASSSLPIPHHMKRKSVMTKQEVLEMNEQEVPDNGAALCLICHTDLHMGKPGFDRFKIASWEKIPSRNERT